MQPGDVAVRGNFCTLDAAGKISDRRAGRIASEESAPLAIKLREVKIPGVEIFVEPVKEHRFVVVFRGAGLAGDVNDTDPQATGVPPLAAEAHDAGSEKTAEVANEFIAAGDEAAGRREEGQRPDAPRLRGAARTCRRYEEVYGLKAAAIAVYPMYKGLARLVGMDIVGKAQTLAEQMRRARSRTGTSTTSSSSTSSTPTARAKTATSTRR